jgi:hypothetical protein
MALANERQGVSVYAAYSGRRLATRFAGASWLRPPSPARGRYLERRTSRRSSRPADRGGGLGRPRPDPREHQLAHVIGVALDKLVVERHVEAVGQPRPRGEHELAHPHDREEEQHRVDVPLHLARELGLGEQLPVQGGREVRASAGLRAPRR